MTTSLCIIAYLSVIAPLIVLVHELSHAAAALAFVPHDVIVRIGVRPRIQLPKWGRLQVLAQWWGGWVGTWSCVADEVEVGKARYIWIVLAGPVASLLTALLCAALKNALQNGPRIAYALATQMPTWQDCANRPRPSPGRARADFERMCRRVQFRWDWAFSENSTGFHHPDLVRAVPAEAQHLAEQAEAVWAAYAGH